MLNKDNIYPKGKANKLPKRSSKLLIKLLRIWPSQKSFRPKPKKDNRMSERAFGKQLKLSAKIRKKKSDKISLTWLKCLTIRTTKKYSIMS